MNKQIDIQNKNIIQINENFPDTLTWWMEQYFKFEVTTSESSRKIQLNDISLFINFMIIGEKSDQRVLWSPRLSKSFHEHLKSVVDENKKKRRWGDVTIKRIFSHLKTFAKWIHKIKPFPLGNPTDKIKFTSTGTRLEIERALTKSERNRILDAADLLIETGGFSKDRNRYKKKERPRRKGFRPYRNRAIIYTLIETGMRRAGIVNLNIEDIEFKSRILSVIEKGGLKHNYLISQEGLSAISDYIENEREEDNKKWNSEALFLSAKIIERGLGSMTPVIVNKVWNDVCRQVGIEGKTPHSARHAMGKHIIEKTGNIAAVQRQLGHKNAIYSMQYSRITSDELKKVLDDR